MDNSLSFMGVKGGPAIRPGSNMPTSMLLKLNGKNILIDAGLGVTRGICDQGVTLTQVDMIFVTHLHSDHYLELGPLLHTAWVAGLNQPIPIIGPSGLIGYWQGFLQSMQFDVDLRIADEGRCDLQTLADLKTIHDGVIYDQDGIKITAMRNDHPPIKDSFALRFETPDTCVVLSGDTAFMDEMIPFAKGADLLVHEAMLIEGVYALCAKMTNGDDRLLTHILRSHTSAEDVGRIAHAADVKHLALNHFVPDGDPDFTDAHWESDVRKQWSGPLTLGKDGMTLPI